MMGASRFLNHAHSKKWTLMMAFSSEFLIYRTAQIRPEYKEIFGHSPCTVHSRRIGRREKIMMDELPHSLAPLDGKKLPDQRYKVPEVPFQCLSLSGTVITKALHNTHKLNSTHANHKDLSDI